MTPPLNDPETPMVKFRVGGKYNWKNQEERLVYLGHNFSGNGFWHQFALVGEPSKVWCEVMGESLQYFEETKPSGLNQ